jgi:hypothetical protein
LADVRGTIGWKDRQNERRSHHHRTYATRVSCRTRHERFLWLHRGWHVFIARVVSSLGRDPGPLKVKALAESGV